MLNFLVATQNATANGGNVFLGLIVLGCGIWFIAALSRPKNKGWNIQSKGETTIKPRK